MLITRLEETLMPTPLPRLPEPIALGSHIRYGAMRTPDQVALMMLDGPARTYAHLESRTNRLAQALLGAQLHPGDRVGVWMDNCLEYLDFYIACLKAGLVVVQVNIRHTAHEAQYQLENSGCTALLFDDVVAERVEKLALGGQLRLLLTSGNERVAGSLDFEDFLETGSDVTPAAPHGDDLAVIGYTSGTTGFPKGAELTHRSIRTLGQTNAFSNRYVMKSVQIFPLSMSFTAGIPAHILPHLHVGGTSVIMREWDTERLVDAIDEHRATFTILPSPPIRDFCEVVASRPDRIPSLVSVLHSTAKAPEEHLELLVDTIGPRLVEGWGMTENSGGLVAATTVRDYSDMRPGIFSSTGTAVPDAAIKLLDADDQELPHDGQSVGQLVAHSESLARGYWNNPEASAKTFRDGWYFTGDLGRIDPDGYVYIIDRRVDLILSGGMNVYPSELERVILQVPGVQEVSVVAAPHDKWGQTPVAFILPSDSRLTMDGVAEYCREHLAGYKQPSEIHFVTEFPKNASGKILKQKLRDSLDAGTK